MDYSKLYCPNHPFEKATIFCMNDECLLALCADCLCQHTEHHNHNRSQPNYQNIRNTFLELQTDLRTQIETLEDEKFNLTTFCSQLLKNKANMRKTLEKARTDCIQAVNRFFDESSQSLQQQVRTDSLKHGYHCMSRLESLSSMMSREISGLIECSQQLNQRTFLDSYRRIKKTVIPQSKSFHLNIAKEITNNKAYQPQLKYRQELVGEIINNIKRILTLKFVMPQEEVLESTKNYSNGLKFKENQSKLTQSITARNYEPQNVLRSNSMNRNSKPYSSKDNLHLSMHLPRKGFGQGRWARGSSQVREYTQPSILKDSWQILRVGRNNPLYGAKDPARHKKITFNLSRVDSGSNTQSLLIE